MHGLRVSVPERGTPTAEFTCQCGDRRRARGPRDVQALAAHAQQHRDTCTGAPARPCEHCGQPTSTLSNGLNGYPAHPACREAWETRKPEVRRREKAAEQIKQNDKQRYKARVLREQLERDGYAADVIDALIAGGQLPDPERDPGEDDEE